MFLWCPVPVIVVLPIDIELICMQVTSCEHPVKATVLLMDIILMKCSKTPLQLFKPS